MQSKLNTGISFYFVGTKEPKDIYCLYSDKQWVPMSQLDRWPLPFSIHTGEIVPWNVVRKYYLWLQFAQDYVPNSRVTSPSASHFSWVITILWREQCIPLSLSPSQLQDFCRTSLFFRVTSHVWLLSQTWELFIHTHNHTQCMVKFPALLFLYFFPIVTTPC